MMSNAVSKVRESRFDHRTRFLRPRNRVEIKNTRLEVLWSRVRCWQRGSRDHGVACTLSRRDFSPVKVASMITNAPFGRQRRVTLGRFDPSPSLMIIEVYKDVTEKCIVFNIRSVHKIATRTMVRRGEIPNSITVQKLPYPDTLDLYNTRS